MHGSEKTGKVCLSGDPGWSKGGTILEVRGRECGKTRSSIGQLTFRRVSSGEKPARGGAIFAIISGLRGGRHLETH